jgi:DNA polymerase III epsilon subunit-like protein
MKNKIIVFDTETTGDFTTPLIYDIAWKVLNENLEVVETREFIVKEIFSNNFLMSHAYYKEKREDYYERIEYLDISVLKWVDILNLLFLDINQYGIDILSAYNIAFDYKAILETTRLIANHDFDRVKKNIDKLNLLCIWNLTVETLFETQDYVRFVYEHNLFNITGNPRTSAEVAYQVLTNNIDFVESHTALKDTEIEVEILKHCLENYKVELSFGLQYNCWTKLKFKKGK